MPYLREIELDVLKPHLPNVLEFSQAIASIGPDYQVYMDVVQMDEKTETLVIVIKGTSLDYKLIEATINNLGGSIHSIDKCLVVGDDSE